MVMLKKNHPTVTLKYGPNNEKVISRLKKNLKARFYVFTQRWTHSHSRNKADRNCNLSPPTV